MDSLTATPVDDNVRYFDGAQVPYNHPDVKHNGWSIDPDTQALLLFSTNFIACLESGGAYTVTSSAFSAAPGTNCLIFDALTVTDPEPVGCRYTMKNPGDEYCTLGCGWEHPK